MDSPQLDLGNLGLGEEDNNAEAGNQSGFAPDFASQKSSAPSIEGTGPSAAEYSSDIWANSSDPLDDINNQFQMPGFEVSSVKGGEKNNNAAAILLLIFFLMVGGFVFLMRGDPVDVFAELFSGNLDPLNEEIDYVSQSIGFMLGVSPDPALTMNDINNSTTVPSGQIENLEGLSSVTEQRVIEETDPVAFGQFFNPYQKLPNSVLGFSDSWVRAWTSSEKNRMVELSSSPFIWQKYVAVSEIYRYRLKDGKDILSGMLTNKKLWLKVRAMIALAGIGFPLTYEEMELKVQPYSTSLVSNFFKRFHDWSTPSERYVMREMLKFTKPAVRATILEGLLRYRDSYTYLYASAATFDRSPEVREVLSRLWPAVPLEQLAKYQAIAEKGGTFSLEETSLGIGVGSPLADQAEEGKPIVDDTDSKGLDFGKIIIYEDADLNLDQPDLIEDFN